MFSILSLVLFEQEVLVSGEFTVTLNDKYVNNQNKDKVEATININPELETEEPIKANVYPVDSAGNTVNKKLCATDIEINPYTSKEKILIDTTKYAKMPEGVNTLRLISDEGKVLAEFTIEKHTTEVNEAKIVGAKGNRPGSTGEGAGTVSFEIQSDVKIVKAYYVAVENGGTAPTSVADFKDGDNYKGVIEVTNNSVKDAPIPLKESLKDYKVYFILEDEYGSVSEHICNSTDDSTGIVTAVIPKGDYTKNAATVTKVEMPNLDDETDTSVAKVKITVAEELAGTEKFVAVLYRDGKVIDSAEITDGVVAGAKTVEFALDKFENETVGEAGQYYVTVYGEGDANTAPSGTTKSNTVTVTPLKSVDNVEYSMDMDGHSKISWKTSHHNNDINGYEVKVAKYDQNSKDYVDFEEAGEEVTSKQPAQSEKDSSVLEITDPTELKVNVLYKAQVVVEAKTGHKLSESNSEPAVSKEFFKPEVPKVVLNSATDSKATLELSTKTGIISGKKASYRVEVYTVNEEDVAGKTEVKYTHESSLDQKVEVNTSNGRFDVTGLSGNAKYAIRLIATVDGVDGTVEGVTKFVELDKTKKAMIDIDADIVEDGTDTRTGKVSADGTTLSLSGTDYTIADYVGLDKVSEIIQALKAGDHITYSTDKPDEVAITISTTDQTASTRTLPDKVEGMKVTINGNSFDQTIATSTKKPAEVTIIGAKNGSLNITGVQAENDRIIVKDAAVTTGAGKSVIIAAGSTVNFKDSNYTANASKETPVTVNPNAVEVTTTADNASNALKFTEVASGLTVNFNSEKTTEGTQAGTLEISGKGDVTVNSNGMTVSSDITIDTLDGKVDIDDEKLTGHQNVTVSYDTVSDGQVDAFAAENAPFDITTPIEIKHYEYDKDTADHTDYDALTAIPGVKVEVDKGGTSKVPGVTQVEDVEATKANFEKINNYLAKFNLIDTAIDGTTSGKSGATITASKDSKKVTITFDSNSKDAKGNVQKYKIGNLK